MNKTILIVDDNLIARILLKRLVSKMGFYPLLAENGYKALEILHMNPHVNAIISDFKMPHMNGIELIQQIRSQQKLKHTPIMILTAYMGEISSFDIDGLGPLLLESKPLHRENLLEFLMGQSTMLIG